MKNKTFWHSLFTSYPPSLQFLRKKKEKKGIYIPPTRTVEPKEPIDGKDYPAYIASVKRDIQKQLYGK